MVDAVMSHPGSLSEVFTLPASERAARRQPSAVTPQQKKIIPSLISTPCRSSLPLMTDWQGGEGSTVKASYLVPTWYDWGFKLVLELPWGEGKLCRPASPSVRPCFLPPSFHSPQHPKQMPCTLTSGSVSFLESPIYKTSPLKCKSIGFEWELHLMLNSIESTFSQYCLHIVYVSICFHFLYILKNSLKFSSQSWNLFKVICILYLP